MITNWVVCSILKPKRSKDRARVLTKFIKIARQLRTMQSFNSLMAVLGGINHSSVIRLVQTRNHVSKKQFKMLESLDRLMSMRENFRSYRHLLADITPPAIPFLGLAIADFTFVSHGNSDFVDHLINFAKRKLMYNCIEELRTLVANGDSFPVYRGMDLITERMLQKTRMRTEEELYDLSLSREAMGPGEIYDANLHF